MRFILPQFSDHEIKVIGPLTFSQSAYIGTAGVIIFILYKTQPFSIFLPIAIILGLISVALSFLKINGIPLPTVLTNGFNFFLSSRVYLWKKTKIAIPQKTKIQVFEKSNPDKSSKVTRISYLKKTKNKIN